MTLRHAEPPSTLCLIFFRIFVLALAIWLGAGLFSAINTNPAWYADPAQWVRGTSVRPGTINPWPILTVLASLSTLIATAMFARYRGPGRSEVLVSLGGTLLILIVTFIYFVPRLMLLFGQTEGLSDAQIISYSRQWVVLNCLRLIMLTALLYAALSALSRMGRRV